MKFLWILALFVFMLQANETLTCKTSSYADVDIKSIDNLEAFNLKWAQCEKDKGNKDAALSAYERVLLINPHNTQASLALLSLYSDFHLDNEKKALLKQLENIRLTPSQREVLASFVQKDEAGCTSRGSILIESGYDTNVNLLPHSNIIEDNTAKESLISNVKMDLNFKNDLGKKGGFSLKSNTKFLQQSVYMAHEFDLFYGSVDVGLGYDNDYISLYLPVVYSYAYYLERSLLQQYAFAPSLSVAVSHSNILSAQLTYQNIDYFDETDINRNSSLLSGSLGYYYLFDKNFFYLQAKYDIYKAKKDEALIFTNRTYLHVKSGLSYKVAPYLITQLDYSYIVGDFDDAIAQDSDESREDTLHQANVNLMVPLNKNINLQVNIAYYNNSSNFELAVYEKKVATVAIEYNY